MKNDIETAKTFFDKNYKVGGGGNYIAKVMVEYINQFQKGIELPTDIEILLKAREKGLEEKPFFEGANFIINKIKEQL